ncbi:MAG TPA: SAM-dependent methyltransferase [Nocardioidaceae bacterium]
MDPVAFGFLLTPAGQALLRRTEAAYDEGAEGHNELALARALRREYDAGHVSAALTQVELRRRASAKFGDQAARMYFTPDGLEQATHPAVADYRAVRLAALVDAPDAALVDLGCGIGSDLVSFARHGFRVVGFERDRATAAVAAANLSSFGLPGHVEVGDVTAVDHLLFDVAFADPSRRSASGRTFDPHSYAPPWSFVEDLLSRRAVVKVAPGIPHAIVPDDVETEWVSLDGQLKEATLWSGFAPHGRARATLLRSGVPPATLTDRDTAADPVVRSVGRYVYEPDDAVIRAHLVTTVCALVDGWLLDEHVAYVSADRLVQSPFAAAYEVLDVLPFKERQLRAALRTRDVGPLTIKKRGVRVTPEALRTRLALSGTRPATLVLTRTPHSAVALLVDRRR